MHSAPAFLTPHDLVNRWCEIVTIGTLANWRCKRVGPAFVKLRGRILYPAAQVEAWEAQNLCLACATTQAAV